VSLPSNEERNAEIIRRRKAGEWPRAIARSMGLSPNAVIGVCNRAGLSGMSGHAECPRGESSPRAKLTEEIVRSLRARYKPRDPVNSFAAMAREFGVDRDVVRKCVVRLTWAHIT
jgi:hypothetical protein